MTKNVLDWLEQTEKKYPKKIAFCDPENEITFQDLVEKSQLVGSYLLQQIQRNEPVGIYMEKSVVSTIGLFGVIYAGGFYSFLDSRQPEHRLKQIETVLQPKVILTDVEHLKEAEEHFECEVVTIEPILEGTWKEDLTEIRQQSLDMDPLYVNFTSGSTGIPKGVTVSHQNVIDFIETFVKTVGIKEDDILGNQAPYDFDVSVKDIYSGIYTGATVAIIPRDYFSQPTKLMDYLCEKECTVLTWAVSAMCFVSIMNGFGYKVPKKVRQVMFSGEVMPIKQLNKWKEALPHTTFINLYGPTEITCNCTYYVLEDRLYDLEECIPIGKPFENEKVFLLDGNDCLIEEENKEGEICVSGTCVSLGYYNDPERTNLVFVQNPLNSKTFERIYRTGDLGKYDSQGNLIYTSRKDFQIKHLGHRIELGEIESQVEKNACVSRAVCIYDSMKKRILLFYTGSIESKALLLSLHEILPPYMQPNKAIQLEELPMTKNGKIDRNALKELGAKKHVG